MNAVVIAIAVMFLLSLARVSVVLTLVVSAIVGGLVAGLSLSQTVEAFNAGLGDGAEVALAYAVLGAFALALSKSGLPDLLAHKLIGLLGMEAGKSRETKVKYLLLGILLIAAIFSQNLIPVHIAFIPVLVPSITGNEPFKIRPPRRSLCSYFRLGWDIYFLTCWLWCDFP